MKSGIYIYFKNYTFIINNFSLILNNLQLYSWEINLRTKKDSLNSISFFSLFFNKNNINKFIWLNFLPVLNRIFHNRVMVTINLVNGYVMNENFKFKNKTALWNITLEIY